MDVPTYVGYTFGSFVIPAAVFWIFFRWARAERGRSIKIIAGWCLGLFLIYAATLPAGRGFIAGVTAGHLLAVALGLFLTYRVIGQRSQEEESRGNASRGP